MLKAAHHGSSTSNSREFLEITDPDYAVIMCGQGNSYNHPNKDAVERIRKHTDRIYRTDLEQYYSLYIVRGRIKDKN